MESGMSGRLKHVTRRILLAVICLGQIVAVHAQTNFATLTTDGAWTWFNDPRAVFHHGKLYFGYVRAADSKTVLSAFDLTTGLSTNLWIAGFSELDDHDNPGLLVKTDDTMLAAYSRHGAD